MRDRDGTCGAEFAAVFVAEGLEVISSAPQAPRVNARCGRIVDGIRREMLAHVLIVGEAHARHVLAAERGEHARTRMDKGIRWARPQRTRSGCPDEPAAHSPFGAASTITRAARRKSSTPP